MEERFWNRYRDRGLVVVGLNAHDAGEQIGEVDQFVRTLGVTFDVGLEHSGTYSALTRSFDGVNPFPVDVIVDRDGTIVYVAREYDPEAIEAVLMELLGR